ncbi:MAG: hypothetical protein KC593_15955 [Myxococcales bacterium]|nr:hypothetical protein [Myxococcales bacterium]MCB9629674.1 hypothetical protein [Sandaracinaceae bacterium]
MLEKVALHQNRFRTPGVGPDARGVLIGQKGVVLFSSLDRLVAFFRAYSDEGSLDELLAGLAIRRVTTALRTRELLLYLDAESSYRMDRVASIAKLAGGMVFTGTQRHFVQYRDAASPLGYDVLELQDREGDAVLYHDTFEQAYTVERELGFRDLLLTLAPYRVASLGLGRAVARAWVTAEVGIGHALIGYLFRWQVDARAGFAEWPSESAFDDAPRRLFLFDLQEAPERILALLRDLPGVRVYEPSANGVAVQVGFRHPIALDSCASLFQSGLTLLSGAHHAKETDGKAKAGLGSAHEVLHFDPLPAFAPVRSLVRATLEANVEAHGERPPIPVGNASQKPLTLRLAQTSEPFRNVHATVVPIEEREYLARMLYVLPPKTLAALRVAVGQTHIYVLDPQGIEGLPLGRFYSEVAERIYVPAGLTLVPSVAPQVLKDLVQGQGEDHVFFHPEESVPRRVANAAFGLVTRSMIDSVAARAVHADAPERFDPPLPVMAYDELRRFPLRGVPQPPEGADGAG